MLNSDYPYTGKNGTCKFKAAQAKVKVAGYSKVTGGNKPMMSAVNQQPVSVHINAKSKAFRSYKSGVLSGACETNSTHVVVITGYNSTASTPYWIVRNSWGTSFGKGGYINMV